MRCRRFERLEGVLDLQFRKQRFQIPLIALVVDAPARNLLIRALHERRSRFVIGRVDRYQDVVHPAPGPSEVDALR